jgi:hypothetical protein
MPPRTFLLHFDSRSEAASVLTPLGIELDEHATSAPGDKCRADVVVEAAFGDGIVHRPTGETVEFEGEPLALTAPVPGYHVFLVWPGDLPRNLYRHLVSEQSC